MRDLHFALAYLPTIHTKVLSEMSLNDLVDRVNPLNPVNPLNLDQLIPSCEMMSKETIVRNLDNTTTKL